MMNSAMALEGIRVVDLTTVLAGPGGTQVLGDLGADVIKVEPPFGDETRRMGRPVYHDGSAGSFVSVNRNKRCISLDLARPEGRDVLLRLLGDADVLFENFKPGTLAKWGFDYDTVLRERFPRLIYCQVTAYGDDGPLGGLPGYDPITQAYCGIMSLNGLEGGDPLRVNLPAIDWVATLYGVIGVQAALLERNRSGLGQAVRVTLYDAALSLLHPFATNWLMKGIGATRMGNRHGSAAPYDIFAALDGHVALLVNNNRQFEGMCDVLGLPEWKNDPRFQTSRGRVDHSAYLSETLRGVFGKLKRLDVVADLTRAGVPAGPVLDLAEALSHPHAVERGSIIEGENGFKGIASPLRFSRTPVQLRRVPPLQGEHSSELLREAGLDEATIAALIEGRVVVEGGKVGSQPSSTKKAGGRDPH
jgi:crotonobetainyl-CoA:carnitine CoA-transferase CaiB-like acyl-CoA transferase